MNKHQREGRHRISFDMPQALFDLLKEECSQKDTTITKYILRSIVERMQKEINTKIKL